MIKIFSLKKSEAGVGSILRSKKAKSHSKAGWKEKEKKIKGLFFFFFFLVFVHLTVNNVNLFINFLSWLVENSPNGQIKLFYCDCISSQSVFQFVVFDSLTTPYDVVAP